MKDQSLSELIEEIKRWAESEDQILELWIYGSRAKGTARNDSDLDIAHQIAPLSTEAEKNEFWEKVLPRWKQEIQALSPWPIHLEAKVIVRESVRETGKKIYRRFFYDSHR